MVAGREEGLDDRRCGLRQRRPLPPDAGDQRPAVRPLAVRSDRRLYDDRWRGRVDAIADRLPAWRRGASRPPRRGQGGRIRQRISRISAAHAVTTCRHPVAVLFLADRADFPSDRDQPGHLADDRRL